jgi:hypothetical protein
MEVLTLAIACHEGRPPAYDIFVHSGRPRQYLQGLLAQVPTRGSDAGGGTRWPGRPDRP